MPSTVVVYQHTISASEAGTPSPTIREAPLQAHELEEAYAYAQKQVQDIDLQLSETEREQAVRLYNATITDGRYIADFATDPTGVAEKLGLDLSDSAAAAIVQIGALAAPSFPGGGRGLAYVAVAVGIILLVALPFPVPAVRATVLVVDSSGLIKL